MSICFPGTRDPDNLQLHAWVDLASRDDDDVFAFAFRKPLHQIRFLFLRKYTNYFYAMYTYAFFLRMVLKHFNLLINVEWKFS